MNWKIKSVLIWNKRVNTLMTSTSIFCRSIIQTIPNLRKNTHNWNGLPTLHLKLTIRLLSSKILKTQTIQKAAMTDCYLNCLQTNNKMKNPIIQCNKTLKLRMKARNLGTMLNQSLLSKTYISRIINSIWNLTISLSMFVLQILCTTMLWDQRIPHCNWNS